MSLSDGICNGDVNVQTISIEWKNAADAVFSLDEITFTRQLDSRVYASGCSVAAIRFCFRFSWNAVDDSSSRSFKLHFTYVRIGASVANPHNNPFSSALVRVEQ